MANIYKDGILLSPSGATDVTKTISGSLWGDYEQYHGRGGFVIGNKNDDACRFEIDTGCFNFGAVFNPTSLRFFAKDKDTSSMFIDKATGTVVIGANAKATTVQSANLEVQGETQLFGKVYINGVLLPY